MWNGLALGQEYDYSQKRRYANSVERGDNSIGEGRTGRFGVAQTACVGELKVNPGQYRTRVSTEASGVVRQLKKRSRGDDVRRAGIKRKSIIADTI